MNTELPVKLKTPYLSCNSAICNATYIYYQTSKDIIKEKLSSVTVCIRPLLVKQFLTILLSV